MTRYLRGGGIDELHARVSSSGTVDWYLTDQQRSVRHVTDNSGVVQNTIVYDAFGNITSESNASFGDRYKWTGREYDTETGLQYNRARYYDPAIGRWIHRDPIGFDAGDSNLYRYVNNAPVMNTDPSGNQQRGRSLPRYLPQFNPDQGGHIEASRTSMMMALEKRQEAVPGEAMNAIKLIRGRRKFFRTLMVTT
ncbi:MAG: RHS repeat-associated core domain-containing protein [Gemmataceae bacterium]